jgi:hypothetical protein
MNEGGQVVPRYHYRTLSTYTYNRHPNDPEKKRGGDTPDRGLRVDDSSASKHFRITDEKSDDMAAFVDRVDRVDRESLAYLNELRDDG